MNELFDVSRADMGPRSLSYGDPIDISADPYAGQIAGNGKEIWTPQEAADNLNRVGRNWTFGNNDALDDNILTYGFWTEDDIYDSYYLEDGAMKILADSFYIQTRKFAAFNEEQQAMAIANLQLWDDLIAVEFRPATSASEADITFGFVEMSPAAGAHAYYPQEEAFNAAYGTDELGRTGGDVWANYLHQDSFVNTSIGAYAWEAITHEIGHSLGLAHSGDYNASDDNDGDGVPDPITYQGDAYFFQDSQQYTIMSYFEGVYTGQAAVRWAGANSVFVFTQTPQVHDILAVQQVYGADMTTRTGNTVYGFNSTADRGVFDFSTNDTPIVTIWDAGGNDTLDLSGFDSDSRIDLNEGAFTSAGYKIDDATKAYFGELFGLETEADFAAFYAGNGLGPDGQPVDNIGIAYGARIENAIGGIGNDTLIGNALNNRLEGGAGNDVMTGGRGNDTFVFTHAGTDRITDYARGERIDLSALDVTADDVTVKKGVITVELGANDLIIMVSGANVSTQDIYFG